MGNESIIMVIQKMVQEGSPREKIIETLHDLGVSDEQATKLLLIAEADTFTLLKKEINVLVKDEFEGNKKGFEKEIHDELDRLETQELAKAKDIAKSGLGEVEEDIRKESRAYQEEVNKTIGTSQKTVSLVKIAIDSVNDKLSQMDLELEQLKVHKYRKHSMVFSYSMLFFGAVLLVVALYLLFSNFNTIDPAQILLIAIIVLASITLMFASIVG